MIWHSRIALFVLAGLVTFSGACGDAGTPLTPEAELSSRVAGTWNTASSIDPGGGWGINTAAVEGCPIESPDGRHLFFASNRAGGHGGIDIWVTHRQEGREGWSQPENLPAPVNSTANDFCPTPHPDGKLLFVSARPGGCGEETTDIYWTRLSPSGGSVEVENLGCELNSAGNEFSPSYVPAAGGVLFFSSDRRDGPGMHRIYASGGDPAHGWGPVTEIVALNAPGFSTARPNVSRDGRVIVFDSDRPGGLGGTDIWWARRASVHASWSTPVNVGPTVNTAWGESRATLSTDGRRLIFGSNRPGGQGASDIYVAER